MRKGVNLDRGIKSRSLMKCGHTNENREAKMVLVKTC